MWTGLFGPVPVPFYARVTSGSQRQPLAPTTPQAPFPGYLALLVEHTTETPAGDAVKDQRHRPYLWR